MPRETIEILSAWPLYEAVATFLGVLAYPDDSTRRARFRDAWCRAAILDEVRGNADCKWTLRSIRPGLLLMTDTEAKAAEKELRVGAKLLGDRKAAVIATVALFGQLPMTGLIEACGTIFKNTKEERVRLTNTWLGNKDEGTKNLHSRKIKPSRPVIHAAHAYWAGVLDLMRMGRADSEDDAEQIIWAERSAFWAVLIYAEGLRQRAPSIPGLDVREDDLIEFRVVRAV